MHTIYWYLLVLLSSVLMGVATIVEKFSLKIEHATAFSSALAPLVTLFSLVFLPWANFDVSAQQLAILIALGALNAYVFLLSARVFKHGEISIASPAFSSLPTLFVVLLAFPFLGEVLSPFQYIVIAAMILATYMLVFRVKKSAAPGFDSNKYRYMIVFYSVLSAVGTIISRYLLISMNPYTFLILTGIFMSASYTILITVRYGGVKEIVSSLKMYKLPLVAQAILTLGYRATYFVALTVAPVSLAQPLRNTFYVVITVVFAGSLFNEKGIVKKLALALMLVFFAYLLTLNI